MDGSSAEIEAGPLRMKVGLDEITGVEGGRRGQCREIAEGEHYRARAGER